MLFYGIDYHAKICGENHGAGLDFSNRPQLYYYDPTSALSQPTFSLSTLKSVCITGCPAAYVPYGDLMNIIGLAATSYQALVLTESYQMYINTSKYFYCDYYKYAKNESQLDLIDPSTGEALTDWSVQYFHLLSDELKTSSLTPGQGPCYPVYLIMEDFLNRCFPSIPPELQEWFSSSSPPPPGVTSGSSSSSSPLSYDDLKSWINALTDARSYLQDYVTDIYKAWAGILVCGVMGGMLLSLVWMVVLRYFAGCMAWTTVLLVNLLFIVITCLCAVKAGFIGSSAVGQTLEQEIVAGVTDTSEEDKKYFEIAMYLFIVLTGLIFLFTLLMIKRIKIAVACLKVASQAVGSMPSILFFPVVPFCFSLAVIAWFIVVSAALYSAGDLSEAEGGGYQLEWNDSLRYMMMYHLFGYLWCMQFIEGFGLMVIAGAVATFYWTRGDTSKMPFSPVLSSARRTLRYHLGSIAVGSFIVAVIQFVRLVLEYVDRKTKELQEGNPVLKFFMYCIKCCMWYLEKVMKFINRNAYILVAVKGTSYCSSALRAVKLILSNALRLAAVNTVGDALTWLGKVVVALGAGMLMFLLSDADIYTDPESKWYLSSPLLPILLSMLIAFFIASIFFQVYEMAVDTILLSFCEDCQQTDEQPEYAPQLLLDAIGQSRPNPKVAPGISK
eukprot:CAMPEP_0196575494 /NCGR_PEP_ID=MMETSP1081-20130531/4961_1 /TAXON_ID=36882 /ORGANISM="Pyramimonas amylifera, Strain CCMP720" /LENGTH=668 /DNA_ID=CAMNT_0041893815 /DNA_START=86 /DNA_END=2092 /DNA_ORIENTATION=-